MISTSLRVLRVQNLAYVGHAVPAGQLVDPLAVSVWRQMLARVASATRGAT